MTIKYVEGDILDATEQYIAHQTNCRSRGAAGLARSIFERFPHANIYQQRAPNKSVPGTCDISGDGIKERFVIHMHAQRFPGGPNYGNPIESDTMIDRLSWFRSCLSHMSQHLDIQSIAFPMGIGCGLACGTWSYYRQEIETFHHILQEKNPDVIVTLYTLQTF